MAQAAASQYLYGGYGGYGNPRYYGGYTTAYGSGLGGYSSFYPAYGYNNGGYGYGGGYPAYGYGVRRSEFGRAMAYGHQPRY
jgi:hypothetical protein